MVIKHVLLFMAEININKKSNSTEVVNREAINETLTSKNQSLFPVAYTDDIWTIVQRNTEMSKLLNALSGCGEVGTYALNVVLEALAAFINENKDKMDSAFKVGDTQYENVNQIINAFLVGLDSNFEDTSNGITVSISQEDGKITSLHVIAPDFENEFDFKGAAEAVRGLPTDSWDKTEKTVWSAYNAATKAYDDAVLAIADLENRLDKCAPISDLKIRALFR